MCRGRRWRNPVWSRLLKRTKSRTRCLPGGVCCGVGQAQTLMLICCNNPQTKQPQNSQKRLRLAPKRPQTSRSGPETARNGPKHPQNSPNNGFHFIFVRLEGSDYRRRHRHLCFCCGCCHHGHPCCYFAYCLQFQNAETSGYLS